METPGLTNIPKDALFEVLKYLAFTEAISYLACTCTALRGICVEAESIMNMKAWERCKLVGEYV